MRFIASFEDIQSRRIVWLAILGFLGFVYLTTALLSQKCHAKYEMPPYLFEDAKCDDELVMFIS